jgi:TM2 domain-containing membrane protein YozV
MYPPGAVNVTIVNAQSDKKSAALIAEIILSLFGIFGVGWLIGGETTIGIILLVCSFLLYWPLVILGTLLTLGFGLVCLGPLAIGSIIVNALLLNSKLNHKTAPYVMVQSQGMPMPPPRQ